MDNKNPPTPSALTSSFLLSSNLSGFPSWNDVQDIPGFFLRSSLAKTHRDNSDKTIRDILPNSFQLSDIDSFLCFSATISTSGATQYSPEQNSEE